MKTVFSALVLAAAICACAGEWKDIPYYDKDAPAQGNVEYRTQRCKLKLSTPNTGKGFPTLVHFHGGGLSRGNGGFPSYIDRTKIAVVAPNYRLSGKGAECPDYIYDAAAAVAWTIKNIEKYGGDPKKVYVSGQMTTHFRILKERKQKDKSTPDFLIDEYAPVYHAKKGVPYMVFFVGDTGYDWPARVEENALLAARLTRVYKNTNVKFVSIPFGTHGTCGPPSRAMISNMLATGKML